MPVGSDSALSDCGEAVQALYQVRLAYNRVFMRPDSCFQPHGFIGFALTKLPYATDTRVAIAPINNQALLRSTA